MPTKTDGYTKWGYPYRLSNALVALLGEKFFEPPYGSVQHWDLLLHEFGHAVAAPSATGHGEAWGDGVSKAGARIAANMLGEQAG